MAEVVRFAGVWDLGKPGIWESFWHEICRKGPMVLLDVSELSLAYPAAAEGSVRVLKNISLEVIQGEFVAILGPSGCGKSTLLRVLAGLNKVFTGTVRFTDSESMSNPLAISMNFQKPVLLPWLDVEENALLPFEATSQAVTQDHRNRLDRLIEMVGLSGFRTALPHELSGGMQMRAALVRSFITNPRLILMDEPFSALDEVTRARLGIELRALVKDSKATVVFVTHSVQEAVLLADRLILLSARPARVVDELIIDLPSKRGEETISTAGFVDLAARVRQRVAHD